MRRLADLKSLFRRHYTDVTGVDVGISGTKVVRLSKKDGKMTVLGADILPAVSLAEAVSPLALPRPLRSRYVALTAAVPGASVKLLSVPAHSDKSMDAHVSELMGMVGGDAASDVRVGYEKVQESRSEVRVLSVVFPDLAARNLCALFPEGTPAPCSIEYSGLASMTAFRLGVGRQHQEGCVALIDSGATGTMLSFFSKGVLVMVRKFDFGAENILRKLQDNLGVERDVVTGILEDESFDVSRIIHQAMEPFLQQLTISFDFVERRENVRIERLYAGGGSLLLRPWSHEIEAATGQKSVTWNPFLDLDVAPDGFPARLKGQESRLTAAMGAAWAMLEAG